MISWPGFISIIVLQRPYVRWGENKWGQGIKMSKWQVKGLHWCEMCSTKQPSMLSSLIIAFYVECWPLVADYFLFFFPCWGLVFPKRGCRMCVSGAAGHKYTCNYGLLSCGFISRPFSHDPTSPIRIKAAWSSDLWRKNWEKFMWFWFLVIF